MVLIFYIHNVVDVNTYSIFTKMGGRTHSAVPLRPAFATSYILITLSRKGLQTKKEPVITGSYIYTIICEDILMRCAANSIFDCAGVLKCTPSNQIIEVCKHVAN